MKPRVICSDRDGSHSGDTAVFLRCYSEGGAQRVNTPLSASASAPGSSAASHASASTATRTQPQSNLINQSIPTHQ